jgi:tripartite-type tricarboxylate transporter receptor subunit TctC
MKTSLRRVVTPQCRQGLRINHRLRPKTRASSHYPRRQFLRLAVGAAALPAVSRDASAQSYPSRPITMIVPYAAGSGSDIVGRVVAEPMRRLLGQPIIIENVSGADGSIGTGRAARAKPDGYTIEIGSNSSHALNGAFYSLQYDLLNDFAPISPLATASFALYGRKTLPANDLHGLIGWLKANPNGTSVGVYAVVYRLLTAIFQKETGTEFTLVPYRGFAPEMQDLIAGQIDLCFDGAAGSLPLVRAGSIKAYAVTSDARLALAPDIPTFAEMGLPALSVSGWNGFFAPRGTSKDVIDKLNVATMGALADPVVRSRLAELGYEVPSRAQQSPEGLGALQKAGAEKWWPIIKELGIKAQ